MSYNDSVVDSLKNHEGTNEEFHKECALGRQDCSIQLVPNFRGRNWLTYT